MKYEFYGKKYDNAYDYWKEQIDIGYVTDEVVEDLLLDKNLNYYELHMLVDRIVERFSDEKSIR